VEVRKTGSYVNTHLYLFLFLETLVERGQLLTTIPRLSTEWSWSLDYRIFDSIPDWGSILHCDSRNGIPGWGFRTPAIAVMPESKHSIAIGSAVDGNQDYSLRIGEPTDFNKTNHLEVHQRYVSNGDYRYFIIHNGQEVHSKIHQTSTQFYNVKCWACKPQDTPGKFYFSYVIFTNFL